MKPYACIGHINATPRITYSTFINWAWKKASFVVYWLIETLLEIFVAIWARVKRMKDVHSWTRFDPQITPSPPGPRPSGLLGLVDSFSSSIIFEAKQK